MNHNLKEVRIIADSTVFEASNNKRAIKYANNMIEALNGTKPEFVVRGWLFDDFKKLQEEGGCKVSKKFRPIRFPHDKSIIMRAECSFDDAENFLDTINKFERMVICRFYECVPSQKRSRFNKGTER